MKIFFAVDQPVLQTQRLSLELLRLEDVPAIYTYASDPAVAENTSWEAHRDQKATEAFVRHVLSRHNDSPGELHLVFTIKLKDHSPEIDNLIFIDPLRSPGHELQKILLECNRMAMGESDQ